MIQRKKKLTYTVGFLRGGCVLAVFVSVTKSCLPSMASSVTSSHTHLGESDYFKEVIIKSAAWWLRGWHSEYSVYSYGFSATVTDKQTRWAGNSKLAVGENLFCLSVFFHPAMDGQPVQVFISFFFFCSCFYLIMSGLWYWLVFLPQSVNNDLAAAAAGCCCQAFDKHSCRSHITPWLASFHRLPVKTQIRFQNLYNFARGNIVRLWRYIYRVIESSQGLMGASQP